MEIIYLTDGYIAVVDDGEDYELVAEYRWISLRARNTVYAVTMERPSKKMHRLILQPAPQEIIDHKNGYGLDNRRCNIAVVTYQENATNQYRHRAGKSFGVDHMNGAYWRARLAGKHIGLFNTRLDAELAYDQAAREKYGDKARQNHPREDAENGD